jgi:hypothetical protein
MMFSVPYRAVGEVAVPIIAMGSFVLFLSLPHWSCDDLHDQKKYIMINCQVL